MDAAVVQKRLPTEEVLPPAVRLENWYRDDYGHPKLHGNAYGHPGFPDGYPIYTSRLVWISATHAQTQNTLYVLGQKAP